MILVMPIGSTGIFTDKEWANGIGKDAGWETFVARDVVRAIDARYRTIRSGSARGLAGLSEGGYAALNIGIHHPLEFRVLESWSGYEQADDVQSIFGGRPPLLARNSPLADAAEGRTRAAGRARLRLDLHRQQGRLCEAERALRRASCARLRVAHRYFVVSGGHNWALWRRNAWQAISIASAHLAHG